MRKITFLLLPVMLLAAANITAQSQNGGLRGVVTDVSKNVLPGVTMTVTDLRTREVRKVITNEKGEYRFDIPAGIYDVSAGLKGFVGLTLKDINVKEGRTEPLDFKLSLGPLTFPLPLYPEPQPRWIPLGLR